MVVSLKEVRFLDRPAARLCAVGVALLTAVPLAVMHRDDLFPPERAAVNADDPVARCLAERGIDIDQVAADGNIPGPQAERFKGPAEALSPAPVAAGNNRG